MISVSRFLMDGCPRVSSSESSMLRHDVFEVPTWIRRERRQNTQDYQIRLLLRFILICGIEKLCPYVALRTHSCPSPNTQ